MGRYISPPATQLVDENGVPYGVKHIDNKPRVSAMSYLLDIAEGNVPNHTSVNKFGQNPAVGATLEDVWGYSALYDYLADDVFAIMYISSDDELSDVGLTFSVTGIDSDYNYSTVTGTLHAVDARIMVALTSGAADNKWWRIFRVTNTSGTPVTGNIYASKDNTDAGGNGIPDDTDDIQAQIIIGNEQTLMALWSCPVGNTAYLTNFFASTSSNKITSVRLFVRPFGGVFNIKASLSINQGHMIHHYDFPVVIAAKSDVKIMASAVGGGGIVSAGFDLWFES
ncbi:hypothetical protein LCGC14_0395040 [marine sediment metagenome]|uniref:Uncharacterized protein n=1 Tax=marine sediment metagenome TaxID=412755 RepID=A0A0F9T413_9ZZZZ